MLRWIGGKGRQWKWLSDLVEGEGYREYCVGGGSMIRRRRKTKSELISDVNPRLINLYQVVKRKHRELVTLIEDGGEIDKSGFARCVTMKDRELGDVMNAYVFLVINRYSWMSHGVQYDKDRSWGKTIENIHWWNERLKGVAIECANLLEVNWTGKIRFLDPPYLHGRRMVTNLYEYEMTDKDHIELLEKAVKTRKGRTIICGVDSILYHSYLKGWNRREWTVRIGCGKDMLREVVWWRDRI